MPNKFMLPEPSSTLESKKPRPAELLQLEEEIRVLRAAHDELAHSELGNLWLRENRASTKLAALASDIRNDAEKKKLFRKRPSKETVQQIQNLSAEKNTSVESYERANVEFAKIETKLIRKEKEYVAASIRHKTLPQSKDLLHYTYNDYAGKTASMDKRVSYWTDLAKRLGKDWKDDLLGFHGGPGKEVIDRVEAGMAKNNAKFAHGIEAIKGHGSKNHPVSDIVKLGKAHAGSGGR
ncbi:MAG: hypothetical protein LBL52_03045 [Rickettsiales bacterium]|jgi:hypothetical protein|nr:hypothetical protein [Rickettsiales bacterium]